MDSKMILWNNGVWDIDFCLFPLKYVNSTNALIINNHIILLDKEYLNKNFKDYILKLIEDKGCNIYFSKIFSKEEIN